MKFTANELLCFNSALGGGQIFGTHFNALSGDTFVQQTVDSLTAKGFLTDGHPNKLFYAAAEMLKEYKTANVYLLFNKARLSLGGRFTVVLSQLGEELYDLTRMDKALFLASLLDGSEPLRGEDTIEPQQVTLDPATWNNTWKPREVVHDYFFMQKTRDGVPGALAITYRIDEFFYIYRPVEETLTKCGPSEVRRTLVEMLDLHTLLKEVG